MACQIVVVSVLILSVICIAEATTLVNCQTSPDIGSVVINIEPSWSPIGASRFLEMVEKGVLRDAPVYRYAKDFLIQFGPTGASLSNPVCQAAIPDDPSFSLTFTRGFIAFAGSGPNSRTCQLFIGLKDSTSLGKQPWETPIGYIDERYMKVVDSLYSGYGDQKPWGNGPDMGLANNVQSGDVYLKRQFPLLSHLHSCSVMGARQQETVKKIQDNAVREAAAAAALARQQAHAAANKKRAEDSQAKQALLQKQRDQQRKERERREQQQSSRKVEERKRQLQDQYPVSTNRGSSWLSTIIYFVLMIVVISIVAYASYKYFLSKQRVKLY